MATFRYQAITPSGQRRSGELEASSKAAALGALRGKDLRVFSIAPAGVASEAGGGTDGGEAGWFVCAGGDEGRPKLSEAELVGWTDELGDLLGAGLNLEQSLRVLAEVPGGGRGARVAEMVHEKVRNGSKLAEALGQCSPSFDHLYRSLVSAGEKGGVLGPVLERQALYLKSVRELRSKVISSLVYPVILLVSAVGLMAVFAGYLVPKLVVLLKATGGESSPGVRVIMGTSLFLNQYWWLVLGVLVVLVVAVVVILRSPAVRPRWERWQFRLPFVGPVLRGRFHVTYLETVANLTRNGVTLHQALKLGATITTNGFLRGRLEGVAEGVATGGQQLSSAMARSGVFDHPAPDIVKVGERTGDHSAALSKAVGRFESDLETRIGRLTTAIQPVVLLLIATVVGVMAYLMLNVIYDSMTAIRTGG